MNFGLAALSTVLLIALAVLNQWRWGRPAFAFAALVNALYQWPTFLLADTIEASLESRWQFAGIAHFVVFTCIVWTVATGRLTVPARTVSRRDLSVAQMGIPIGLAGLLAGIYFSKVPLNCTALYALLYDPAMTLLAREVTIKLSGSTLATISYGAIANTVAPVCASIGSAQILYALAARQFVLVLAWATVMLFSVTLVMIAGAKGLTLPLLGAVVLSAIFWSSTRKGKAIAAVFSLISVAGALVAFELVRERNVESGSFDFGSCVKKLGSVEQGLELLASIRDRGGLGLGPQQIQELERRIAGEHIKPKKPIAVERRRVDPDRAVTYLQAIVNRALIVPTQVAAWHYLYVEQYVSPGWYAFPLAKKLFGKSVDTSALVYMAYGTIYSDGDATSTSTAPTSYIFTWSAYLGIWGITMIIATIIALDVIVALVMRAAPANILPIGVGLVGVMAFNMISSDFVVVMISHGGLAAIITLVLLTIARPRKSVK